MTAAPLAPPRLLDVGEAALCVEFGETVDPALNARVIALDRALAVRAPPGVVETVPTYRSLLVHLDPLVADVGSLKATILELAARPAAATGARRRWIVPVVYGGAHGEDLAALAERHAMSETALVARHAGAVYTVFMIGFMPGFTYLGGLDPALTTPRRPEPRARVPAFSISIGGAQTAIGSLPAPSGWHLLGRTPVRTFLPGRDPVFLFAPGDEIRFDPVGAEAWDTLDARAAVGEPVAREGPG